MPEPCLQCSARKDDVAKNCTFRGWGTPCGPCDASHVSCCEYYLPAARRGEIRDLIRQRVAIHAPAGKSLFFELNMLKFLLTFIFLFQAFASLIDLISEDALHMRTLAALLESIRRRRDANLQEFSNGLADLCLTAESDTLVGNVFESQEEFASWFNFAKEFVGTERASTPEGASRADLEGFISRVSRVESPPVAGPSRRIYPRSPFPQSPVDDASASHPEDEGAEDDQPI